MQHPVANKSLQPFMAIPLSFSPSVSVRLQGDQKTKLGRGLLLSSSSQPDFGLPSSALTLSEPVLECRQNFWLMPHNRSGPSRSSERIWSSQQRHEIDGTVARQQRTLGGRSRRKN